MFSTLETFYNDYRIKNDMFPNETVLNRPSMRLKREIRELKSLSDIVTGTKLEEYSPYKVYEIDEYVEDHGLIYKSLADTNYGFPTSDTNWWQQVNIRSVNDASNGFTYCELVADGKSNVFVPTFKILGVPAVFRNGVLLKTDDFEYTTDDVTLKTTPDKNDIITITSAFAYETGTVFPKTEIVSEQDQYEFTVDFQLVQPSVFVNGVLLPTTEYTYGRNNVDLNTPLKEGDIVTIANGSTSGLSIYTKTEIDNILTDYYLKTETYSKKEVDDLISKEVSDIYADDTIVKKDDVYLKQDMDKILGDYATIEYVDENLTTKADKSTTLAGYGITDAYTKDEILGLLDKELDIADFTKENILYILQYKDGNKDINAEMINGLYATQFMRSDVSTTNVGGVEIFNNSSTTSFWISPDPDTINYPDITINRNIGKVNEKSYASFSEINSQGLVIFAEGDFSGTWYQNLYDFGILDPQNYNFTITVTNLGTGTQYDFLPKGYGTGFNFTSFAQNKESEEGSYQYGFIKDNIVKMFSYVKTDDETFIPIPGHYVLTGYHKSISRMIYHNQGDQPEEMIANRLTSDAEKDNYLLMADGYETPTPPDVLDDNAFKLLIEGTQGETVETEKPPVYHPTIEPIPAQIFESGTSTVFVSGLPMNTPVNITIVSGDGTLVETQLQSDAYGEAYAVVQSQAPYTEDVIVEVSGDNIYTTQGRIDLIADIDTVLNNLHFGTVGINNNPSIGLEGTMPMALSGNIQYGNNVRKDIILAFTNVPEELVGKDIKMTIDSMNLTGTNEQTVHASMSASTDLDGTIDTKLAVIPICSGHDLDWYYERNGTYHITLEIDGNTKTYELVINVPRPNTGFDTELKSFESFTAPFA